jgi:2,3-diketo-5-methylthio-1-phosphopentane phosphatase
VPVSDWVVCCDFDGTIALPDAGEHLLAHFGAPEWRDLDAAVWRGELSEREAWTRQIGMLRCTWAQARAGLKHGISIRSGFVDFVDFCRARDVPFVILSSGLKPVIDAVLADAGISALTILANDVAIHEDRWQLIPHPVSPLSDRCLHCKCVHLLRLKAEHKKIAYIGDGLTDVCPSMHADLVFATGNLAADRGARNLPHIYFESFSEIESSLARLLDNPAHTS